MTAEEYIKAYTRGCSNELVGGGYHEWLTPENALAAVELAREEMKKDAIECNYRKGLLASGHYLHDLTMADFSELAKVADRLQLRDKDKVKVIIIKE